MDTVTPKSLIELHKALLELSAELNNEHGMKHEASLVFIAAMRFQELDKAEKATADDGK